MWIDLDEYLNNNTTSNHILSRQITHFIYNTPVDNSLNKVSKKCGNLSKTMQLNIKFIYILKFETMVRVSILKCSSMS